MVPDLIWFERLKITLILMHSKLEACIDMRVDMHASLRHMQKNVVWWLMGWIPACFWVLHLRGDEWSKFPWNGEEMGGNGIEGFRYRCWWFFTNRVIGNEWVLEMSELSLNLDFFFLRHGKGGDEWDEWVSEQVTWSEVNMFGELHFLVMKS